MCACFIHALASGLWNLDSGLHKPRLMKSTLEAATEAKAIRDIIRNEIVKSLKEGRLDDVMALLVADDQATETLWEAVTAQVGA